MNLEKRGGKLAGDRWKTGFGIAGLLFALVFFLVPPVAAQDWDREFWLDQRVSFGLTPETFFILRFSERANQDISHLFENFVEIDAGFHVRPWLTIMPGFTYLRFDPYSETSRFENRPQLAFQLHTRRDHWRPNVGATLEGRFPQNDSAFIRFLLRPGVEYDVSTFRDRAVVFWLNNEFAFDSRSDRFSRNRFQAGFSLPASEQFSIFPYYLIESIRLPGSWDHDNIIGLSLRWHL